MRTVETEIGAILEGAISEITQRSIFRRLGGMARAPLQHLTTQDRQTIQAELESSVRLFAPGRSAELIAACARALALAGPPAATRAPGAPLTAGLSGTADADKRLAIESEKDIASARLEAWSEAVRIGLSKFASVKVATAVSELARNIVFYAGTGTIELHSRQEARETRLEIVAADQGTGIEPAKLDAIFAGTYRSERGLGKGLVAVQKLVDEFAIDTRPGRGTRVSCVFRGAR
ncbi:MAG TPA: ATP-binding protein [Thermoanaerobaculia bacterium]|nr:ATP-binding protein [Thermoanaerobaculia bacterium]